MSVLTIEEMASQLPREGRILAVDHGSKTLGLAISDSERRVASALETLRRTKFTQDAKNLTAVMEEKKAMALIIGLPINMDGSEGPRCQSVRQFADNLIKLTGFTYPICFWDERLSTAAVQRFLTDEADMTRRHRAKVVDKLAAAYILQGALDFLGRHNPS